jgi:hypothetical protein
LIYLSGVNFGVDINNAGAIGGSPGKTGYLNRGKSNYPAVTIFL